MDPVTAIVLLALLGVGGTYAYKRYYPSTAAPAPKPGGTTGAAVFADPSCQAQYNSLPPVAKQQVDAAVAQAKSQGGAVGAATLSSAAGILKGAYPSLATCLQSLAAQIGGASPAANVPGPAGAMLSGQCLAIYQGLDPATRAAVDAAVNQAKGVGGGAAGAMLLQQYASSIAGANPALSTCLAGLASAMAGPGGGGGVAPPVIVPGPAAALLNGQCLAIYQGLDPATRAAVDAAVTQAKNAGSGAAGAALLSQYAATLSAVNPTLSSCLAGAATAMGATSAAAPPAGDGGATMGSGSGASFLQGDCLTTYLGMDPAGKGAVDSAIDAAHGVGGGKAGAGLLATAAQSFLTTNPNMYGCLLAAATAMNGGVLPDSTDVYSPGTDPGTADPATGATGWGHPLNYTMAYRRIVGATGVMPHLRGPIA